MTNALNKVWAHAAANDDTRAGPKRKARKPVSIRFSEDEWAALDMAAGETPVGTFVRRQALAGLELSRNSPERRRTRGRMPVKDQTALARLLGELGRSRLSANLNQLAKAANMGVLAVSPETVQALTQACAEVKSMRAELIRALGLKAEE